MMTLYVARTPHPTIYVLTILQLLFSVNQCSMLEFCFLNVAFLLIQHIFLPAFVYCVIYSVCISHWSTFFMAMQSNIHTVTYDCFCTFIFTEIASSLMYCTRSKS